MSTTQIRSHETIDRLCVLSAHLRRARALLDEHIELHPLTADEFRRATEVGIHLWNVSAFVTDQRIKQQIAGKQPASDAPEPL